MKIIKIERKTARDNKKIEKWIREYKDFQKSSFYNLKAPFVLLTFKKLSTTSTHLHPVHYIIV